MESRKILALSSSRSGNSGYLENALPLIKDFLGTKPLKIAFVPFASVDAAGDYLLKVKIALNSLPHTIHAMPRENPHAFLEKCNCIMVGGGNTFKLLYDLYDLDILDTFRKKIMSGTPYVGWSAGSNLLGTSINTTNDMPIIQPPSFEALGALPFLINPHYLNEIKEEFHGETRDMRLEEFLKIKSEALVCALPEGSALTLENGCLSYSGNTVGFLLQNVNGHLGKKEILPGTDLSYLLS